MKMRRNRRPIPSSRKSSALSSNLYRSCGLLLVCFCMLLLRYGFLGQSGTKNPHISLEIHGNKEMSRHNDPNTRSMLNNSRPHSRIGNALQHVVRLPVVDIAVPERQTFALGAPLITAILPVTFLSISFIEKELFTLLEHSRYLSEVVLMSPPSLQADVRKALLSVLSSGGHSAHVELSLLHWPPGVNEASAILRIARQVSTNFVLILDEEGLESIDSRSREALTLLEPFSTTVPIGPRGMAVSDLNLSCILPSETPQPAEFLLPPFAMPTILVPETDIEQDDVYGIWATFGKQIARSRSDLVGGFVLGSEDLPYHWCQSSNNSNNLKPVPKPQNEYRMSGPVLPIQDNVLTTNETCNVQYPSEYQTGSFTLIFTSLVDLRHFSVAICRLQREGHVTRALLHLEKLGLAGEPHVGDQLIIDDCTIEYDILYSTNTGLKSASEILDWVNTHSSLPDVVIASFENDWHVDSILSHYQRSDHNAPTTIRIPREDLPYCDWMGSLTLQQYRNWHVPRVDISVITNDRPHSLARLLSSLSNARYFGDSADLRINMEQTTDMETLGIVNAFQWDHGPVFLHRRVIHGGLLPAVVESWYPSSNDSYGLILEDDVELSPLFYAWIKLALLHYRYGRHEDRSPQLFGISLYQQKHLELRLQGRHPFDARSAFAAAGLASPHTPYLSQIPCSWGAVYFPSHWREFHAYLSFRLSELAWPAAQVVAPGVRSNRWTRSWKKYFIELAYLRGYVMLYPNFADYVSLSTNHLEVGSHVKDVPLETYRRKKRLFLLPLMSLPGPEQPNTGLLDLPNSTLPAWSALPILDLLGLLAEETTLVQRGQTRRAELTGCENEAGSTHDIWDLLCLHN